jgi:t-SNARE complex subunit (syntaxin)
MAEPQETRQEQETRWAAQRAAQNKEVTEGRQARQKRNLRIWVTVGVIVIIVVVIAVVVLR